MHVKYLAYSKPSLNISCYHHSTVIVTTHTTTIIITVTGASEDQGVGGGKGQEEVELGKCLLRVYNVPSLSLEQVQGSSPQVK